MARRTTRRHRKIKPRTLRKRMTSMGRLMKPVNIRSSGSMDELLKRIRKGPVTIVLVYADWCGHCHEFMPHFDNASKSPQRTAQVVKLNETMTNEANSVLQETNGSPSSINVTGYPSVLLLDTKGNQITQVPAEKNTALMTTLMNESGNVMLEGSTNASARTNIKNLLKKPISIPKNSLAPSPIEPANANEDPQNTSRNRSRNSAESLADSLPRIASPNMENVTEEEEVVETVSPPVAEELGRNSYLTNSAQKGGTLFSALGTSAYHLAPAGVLLGIAGMTFKKCNRRKKTRRHRR